MPLTLPADYASLTFDEITAYSFVVQSESSFVLFMRNLQLIKDPREHFALFWKQQPQDGHARLTELQEDLRALVRQVEEGQFLSRCATVELLPLPATTPDNELSALLSHEQPSVGSASPQKVPGTYWIVPGDLLEVALLACEIVAQQAHNQQEEKEQFFPTDM